MRMPCSASAGPSTLAYGPGNLSLSWFLLHGDSGEVLIWQVWSVSSFDEHLLHAYCVPGTVLGLRDQAVSKTKAQPARGCRWRVPARSQPPTCKNWSGGLLPIGAASNLWSQVVAQVIPAKAQLGKAEASNSHDIINSTKGTGDDTTS